MAGYFVETYAVNDEGSVIRLGSYHDKELKEFHNNLRDAMIDFGQRVASMSNDNVVSTDLKIELPMSLDYEIVFDGMDGLVTAHIYLY